MDAMSSPIEGTLQLVALLRHPVTLVLVALVLLYALGRLGRRRAHRDMRKRARAFWS